MNDAWQRAMDEAAALTRAGRLAEATALIQQTLREAAPTAEPAAPAAQATAADPRADVIDIEARVVDDAPAAPDAAAPPAKATGAPPPGSFTRGQHRGPTGERAYRLFRPHNPPADGRPPPLLVMLHGCTQTPEDFAAGTRMNALADARGWWVLYPAQSRAANRHACWNWFLPSEAQRAGGETSLLADMTSRTVAAHGLDPQRVYAAGLSAGAAMALALGATHPALIAAVGVHSGLAFGSAHDLPSALAAMHQTRPGLPLTRPLRSIIFHGDQDSTVHPGNADEVLSQVLATGSHSALAVDPASVEREVWQAPGARRCTRSRYRGAQGRVDAELWLIHGAGHAWSGGSPSGSFTEASGPDASAEMLRFFDGP